MAIELRMFTERAETEKRIGLKKIEIEDTREKLKSRFEQIATRPETSGGSVPRNA